jgi:hypothetical protein
MTRKTPARWRNALSGSLTAMLFLPIPVYAVSVHFHDPVTPVGAINPFASVTASISTGDGGNQVTFTFTPAPGSYTFFGTTNVDAQVQVDNVSTSATKVNGTWANLRAITNVPASHPITVTVGQGVPGSNNMFSYQYPNATIPPVTALNLPKNATNTIIGVEFSFSSNTSLSISSSVITLTLVGQ